MEEISKIKSIITKINNKCDKEKTSLSHILNNLNISTIDFLNIIGLKQTINKELLPYLENLFNSADTRISFNASMKTIEEIEIYSSNLNITFHFFKNQYYLNIINRKKDNLYEYININSLIEKNNIFINYELDLRIELKKKQSKVMTRKFPIKHMNIKVKYINEEKEGTYSFTINDDMMFNDLEYVLKLLNTANFIKAYIILNKYPCQIKIVESAKEIV